MIVNINKFKIYYHVIFYASFGKAKDGAGNCKPCYESLKNCMDCEWVDADNKFKCLSCFYDFPL